jgi:predicted transcriptional regulator
MASNRMTEKSNDIIASALGIENKVEVIEPRRTEIINTPHEHDDADADYNLSRRTFRSLIEKGNAAMENLTDLAKESESPRAYEVLATTMKTIADITKDLYDLQKKNKDLKGVKKEEAPANLTVEKAVFVGTTADLLKQMKEKKNENA